MENTLLLISSGSTFMIDALSKGLKDDGIEVIKAEPTIKELEKYKEKPGVFLFYLGSYLENISDVLVFLKDLCIEQEKVLCTIGDASEFDVLKRIIPEHVIKEHFSRPLNVREVADKMLNILSVSDELSRRKHILLVDDDPTFLTLTKTWLDEKYRVSIVNSGMQAITYLANNKPDLILLDYEMPVTSGPQVLEMIRSEVGTSSLPVIFLTGKGDKESVTRVLSLKPEGYILKGIDKHKLTLQIDEFFEKKKY
ncbi:MAG: response regulator [Lachnospiraceae bacterium]|nr:response regulator [Lachnospiraceae bacterium]